MIKIPERVELIFAKAISLHQAGRLKSTVYIHGSEIYLLNGDHTVLINHTLVGETVDGPPIVFNADDYEGALIENVDDQVTFTKKTAFKAETQFTKVNAAVPDISMAMVRDRFDSFPIPKVRIPFDTEWMRPIRDDLSHVELVSEDGLLHLKQRDIYAARVYDTWREPNKGSFGTSEPLPPFGPLGVRTGDFKAVMDFAANPILLINPDNNTYFMVRDAKTKMLALISTCMYDELAYTHDRREHHGRQEQTGGNERIIHQGACGESEAGEVSGPGTFKRRG